jgi:hypothetical protein
VGHYFFYPRVKKEGRKGWKNKGWRKWRKGLVPIWRILWMVLRTPSACVLGRTCFPFKRNHPCEPGMAPRFISLFCSSDV